MLADADIAFLFYEYLKKSNLLFIILLFPEWYVTDSKIMHNGQ